MADGPSSDVLTTLDKMTKRTVAMKIPSNQPTANPALVLPARLESNIKMVAMTAPATRRHRRPTEKFSDNGTHVKTHF